MSTKTKRKDNWQDLFSALTEALESRAKDLNEREAKLQKDREELDAERLSVYGMTNPSDVLHLNIGGTVTTVLRRTLTSIPGSMLASRFSGRWDDNLERDKDGNFFIDQDYSLFLPMLNYLHNTANGTEEYPIQSPSVGHINKQNFYRMVEYYGMTNGIFPTKLTRWGKGPEDAFEIIGSKQVNAKEFTSFALQLDGHSRKIKTYEITLGDVKRVQVGWFLPNWCKFVAGKGAGEMQYSYALDLSRFYFMQDGNITGIQPIEHPKGSVVRSENFGRDWFVNGKRGVPVEMIQLQGYRSECAIDSCSPLISIQGEMEITSVVIEKV
mmetsp:Transcript_28757/g.77868  ORF Transcript_28757/g.77868 Transcript_28757/m.77868 type:complete len:325 (+) Transcript_28757:679-1653(+)